MKYRTKFYLRSVSLEGNKLVAEVEPVSPYLFRIRETEYYGILKEIPEQDNGQMLDGKFIPLHECKNSFGDKTRCFKFEYKLNTSAPNSVEAALLGKSADTIVEIDIEDNDTGLMSIINQKSEESNKCFLKKLFTKLDEVDHPEQDCLLALLHKKLDDADRAVGDTEVFTADLISIKVG